MGRAGGRGPVAALPPTSQTCNLSGVAASAAALELSVASAHWSLPPAIWCCTIPVGRDGKHSHVSVGEVDVES